MSSSLQEEDGCYENGGRQLQRLGNPYDTMMTTASTHDSVPPESGVYSNPGEVTGTSCSLSLSLSLSVYVS